MEKKYNTSNSRYNTVSNRNNASNGRYNASNGRNYSRNDDRRSNDGGTLPLWTGGSLQPSLRQDMSQHTPFVITNDNARNDLGKCVIMLQWPYLVLKVHTFRTSSKQHAGLSERGKETFRSHEEEKRRDWLHQRMTAWRNARRANELHMSVREYIVNETGQKYDEEIDEPRFVVKVPGMNIYLELYGFLNGIEYCGQWKGDIGTGYNTGNTIDGKRLFKAMTFAASYYRGSVRKGERKEFATHLVQWQPLQDWHEEYREEDDRMFIPRETGIGFDNTDPERREPRYPHHLFDDDEKAELNRLKAENINRDEPLPQNELQRRAVANVAARRMLEEMNNQ